MKVKVALQNLRTGDWSWFEFPTNLEMVKQKLNARSGDELIVVDSELIGIPEYTSLREIQQFAEKMEEFPRQYLECLEQWVSFYGGIQGFSREFELDDWTIVETSSDEDFGSIMFYDFQAIKIPTELENYFDFEAYGRDCCLNSNNFFATDNYYVFQ
ncbi:antirestriction protein ArdA [Streptococcus cuniculi]|uniref:Antirestriction protein ArdA n=1 Tax=Streptococcus cuniculi TaxID=1432788 RepID=A0A4Y9JB60_9STRE|nr:antirestriction protein ArdA [Streptococcus cuniculi]MBF0777874.1 antirestriction protein ArdA [Streptococcus cuniculi]TFU98172.1 antirestriction protein ArdA [Streptococcus cuniculi]